MKSSLKKIQDCRVRLTAEIDARSVESRFQEVTKQVQKKAVLPGFREGRVPLDMVETKFSTVVQEEVLKSLIPEAYHELVAKHKLSPVALPAISGIRFERGKSLAFIAEVEVAPEFSLKNYRGIKIHRAPVDVKEDDLQRGLDGLRESKGEWVSVLESRAIRHGDFIVTDVEIWQKDRYVSGKKGILLHVEPRGEDDFYEKVLGAQVDEVREVSVEATEEEKRQGIIGRQPFCKVWIRGIREKRLPDLDDEFAKSFGKETLEELREALGGHLATVKTSESWAKMREELFQKLLGLVSFEPPEELVRKQKERLKTPPGLEAEAQRRARDEVKLYFILQKVAELEGLRADETQVEQKLAAMAEESGRPMEEVRRVFEEDLRESLREKKTVDFLLANAKIMDSAEA